MKTLVVKDGVTGKDKEGFNTLPSALSYATETALRLRTQTDILLKQNGKTMLVAMVRGNKFTPEGEPIQK